MNKTIQGSGEAAQEARDVDSFQGIALHLPAEVAVQRGQQQRVEVTADANLLPFITTEVAKGILRIGTRVNLKPVTPIRVAIDSTGISSVDVHGSGSVTLEEVTEHTAALATHGSGNISARGNVDTLSAIVNGSGNLLLKDLVAKTGNIVTNGSGNIEAHVTHTLSATISGSGNIILHGNPGTVAKRKAGSGDFIAR